MKKKLLLVLALTAFGASAQQKLIGLATTQFDETGALAYNDSIGYTYNSWEGSLTSNGPLFQFSAPVFDWEYELPQIKSDEEETYVGIPLTLDFTRQNTIVNGLITDSEIPQVERQEFTYDAAGNLEKIESFFWNVSQFDIFAANTFEYDANNNVVVEQYISDPITNPNVESVDSMFYDASNNLIRAITYSWDGTTLYPNSQSLITYTGSEISNLQIYEENNSQLEWSYDVYYTYTAGKPSLIEGYPVNAGVPSTVTEIEISYTYDSDDQLSVYQGYLMGDLFIQQDYAYDAEGFVTKIETSDFDFSTSALYLAEVKDFYYQSTASISELTTVAATVYPNPSNDFITIDSDAQIDQISVLNTNGQVLIKQKGNTVDVSHLTTGIYIVNVATSEGVAQTRFVKN